MVNGVPEQLPDFGVTVYVKVAADEVVLVKVWLIGLNTSVAELPPVTAPTGLLTGVGQL